MTDRLAVTWPDRALFGDRTTPIRILAVSDQLDPALEHQGNRDALGPVDLVLGCGDLDAGDLCFLADAFRARLLYVRGNHDRGTRWAEAAVRLPRPARGLSVEAGLRVVGLPWPGRDTTGTHAGRDDVAAWVDVLRVAAALTAAWLRSGRAAPVVVISHGAPRGLGDRPDPYHAGFAAYRWLLERVAPPLWLHGHTNPASTDRRRVTRGRTVVCNVTGSVLIELQPPASAAKG